MSLQIDVLHSFQTADLAQAETENIATPLVLDIPIEMPFQKHLEMARKSQTKIAEKSRRKPRSGRAAVCRDPDSPLTAG